MAENKPNHTALTIGLALLGVGIAFGLGAWYCSNLIISGAQEGWARWGSDPSNLLRLGKYGCGTLSVLLLLAGTIRLILLSPRGASPVLATQDVTDPRAEEIIKVLRSIADRLVLSDDVKRIIYREHNRDAFRTAIEEDISKRDFDAALKIVDQMTSVYGYHEEAEAFRGRIQVAQAEALNRAVSDAIERLDRLIENQQWEKAMADAASIQRRFPNSPRVSQLVEHVKGARERVKVRLEREFLEAAGRDDVEKAMQLLKTLDGYLSEKEAEPFRETARGVISKKRQNLGLQFKLAVADKEWTTALRVGEEIIREFPNSQMSNEVREMLDVLRERSTGEQAAKARETV